MIRWSRQLAHGCVPVHASAIASGSRSAASSARRSAIAAGNVGERGLLARLDLDLGGDQLADEVRLERRVLRRGVDLLEAVDEVERLGIEERELLFDRDGEVLGRLEALVRVGEDLLVPPWIRFAHGAGRLDDASVPIVGSETARDGVSRAQVDEPSSDPGPAPPLLGDAPHGRAKRLAI